MLYRMHFQKIVLIIAIVLLIIMLGVIGVTLSKSRTENNWPPNGPDFPFGSPGGYVFWRLPS